MISPTARPHPIPPGIAHDLTARQGQLQAYIVATIAERGSPPSFREICREFGIVSNQGVSCHLAALVRKGYLALDRPAQSAAYRVLKLPDGRAVSGWQPITGGGES